MAATDWLAFSRRATESARSVLAGFPRTADRARRLGRGEGGDMTLAIDGAVEDALFAELDALGIGLRALSEERGMVDIAGGGGPTLVIDPIDGSLNAKRGLSPYALSIAVVEGGDDMDAVTFGYVADLTTGEEWSAARGEGAHHDGERLPPLAEDARLEILGVESAHPWLVSAGADAIAGTEADRLRMIGSIALSLCYVASSRFDGLLSLRAARSVDYAAGQLIVTEAGGQVAFPDVERATIDLGVRSRVFAAATPELIGELLEVGRKIQA